MAEESTNDQTSIAIAEESPGNIIIYYLNALQSIECCVHLYIYICTYQT